MTEWGDVLAIRKVLLQRMANNLAVAKRMAEGAVTEEDGKVLAPEDVWWSNEAYWDFEDAFYHPCCWVHYGYDHYYTQLKLKHRICQPDCPHWHHQREIEIALA